MPPLILIALLATGLAALTLFAFVACVVGGRADSSSAIPSAGRGGLRITPPAHLRDDAALSHGAGDTQ